MDNLYWELSVLSRAVVYPNLSIASDSVGLSQPQLSRIVSRIERHFKASLLDRTSKRKSGWTPMAIRLAEVYATATRQLDADITGIIGGSRPTIVRVGALEGLSPLLIEMGHHLLANSWVQTVEIDIYELHELEEAFFKSNLDVILSFRSPGRRKFPLVETLGYQSFETLSLGSHIKVMSPFELQKQAPLKKKTAFDEKDREKILISNSLAVRKSYLSKYGGQAQIPSDAIVPKQTEKANTPVMIVASDTTHPEIWDHLLTAARGFKKASSHSPS